MVLKRAWTALTLASAGRYGPALTFYDQAHCTGMDITTSVCVAIVSVSKDMSFRTPPRRPWMRARSRTNVRYALIPEVRAQIKTAGSEPALGDIVLLCTGLQTEIAQADCHHTDVIRCGAKGLC